MFFIFQKESNNAETVNYVFGNTSPSTKTISIMNEKEARILLDTPMFAYILICSYGVYRSSFTYLLAKGYVKYHLN